MARVWFGRRIRIKTAMDANPKDTQLPNCKMPNINVALLTFGMKFQAVEKVPAATVPILNPIRNHGV